MVKLRINMIYIDTELNSKFTVLLNIYQAFRLMTAKYVAYLNDWGADTIRGSKFCHNVIEGTIKFFCISAQRQASQNFVQEVGGKFSVRTNEITWLGRKAFKSGLDRRKAKFYIIIKKIEHDLENQKKKSLNRSRLIKLEAVIRSKANYGLKGIKY
ncbi:hypothetical protein BY996DRAFT_2057944 [Phakopsora pachyrhizi]|nr:hypothetical protein BY996DRAFT_2057944 [Phakopsora pachyrhizi]